MSTTHRIAQLVEEASVGVLFALAAVYALAWVGVWPADRRVPGVAALLVGVVFVVAGVVARVTEPEEPETEVSAT